MADEGKIPVVRRENRQFCFDAKYEPVLSIKSGQTVQIETEDANAGLIRTKKDEYPIFVDLFNKAGGANPVTGPIFVEGAKPGDCLAVKIENITVDRQGYSNVLQDLGALQSAYNIQPHHGARTTICKVKGDYFTFPGKKKKIDVPIEPMIGTIATAPRFERVASFYHGKEYCGNIDCPDLEIGNTVVLPVNVDGGLLTLGDVHGAQGDGEITGCALEIRGAVTVTVELLARERAQFCGWPQVNSATWIGSIGCPIGGSLDDAIRAAYVDLINRMEKFYGFDRLDAYQLLNLVGKVTVGQVVEPLYSCVARIDRRYLESE